MGQQSEQQHEVRDLFSAVEQLKQTTAAIEASDVDDEEFPVTTEIIEAYLARLTAVSAEAFHDLPLDEQKKLAKTEYLIRAISEVEDLKRRVAKATTNARDEVTERLVERIRDRVESLSPVKPGQFVLIESGKWKDHYGQIRRVECPVWSSDYGTVLDIREVNALVIDAFVLNKDGSHKKTRGNRYSNPEEIIISERLAVNKDDGTVTPFKFTPVSADEQRELEEQEEKLTKKELLNKIESLDIGRMKALLEQSQKVDQVHERLGAGEEED